MKPTYTDILLEILTIIKYQNNKEKFVKEFEALNRLDAMACIIDTLPGYVQEKIKSSNNDVEEMKKLIPTNEYIVTYEKVSVEALRKFLEDISSVLTLQQKEQITKLVFPQ